MFSIAMQPQIDKRAGHLISKFHFEPPVRFFIHLVDLGDAQKRFHRQFSLYKLFHNESLL